MCESPADQAAIRILVEAILETEIEVAEEPRLRTGGWSAIPRELPVLLRHLHYHTDVEALVIVADSDDTPAHKTEHDEPGKEEHDCRICEIRRIVALELSKVGPRPHRSPLKIAIGVAVPAIEAWYQCGLDPHNTEEEWSRTLRAGKLTNVRNAFKRSVYGTDRPPLPLEAQCAMAAASRLVSEFTILEQHFPGGFGTFARSLHEW